MFINARIVLTQYILDVSGLHHVSALCYSFCYVCILQFIGTNENHVLIASVQVLFTSHLRAPLSFLFISNAFLSQDAFLISPKKGMLQSFLFSSSYAAHVVLNIYFYIFKYEYTHNIVAESPMILVDSYRIHPPTTYISPLNYIPTS